MDQRFSVSRSCCALPLAWSGYIINDSLTVPGVQHISKFVDGELVWTHAKPQAYILNVAYNDNSGIVFAMLVHANSQVGLHGYDPEDGSEVFFAWFPETFGANPLRWLRRQQIPFQPEREPLKINADGEMATLWRTTNFAEVRDALIPEPFNNASDPVAVGSVLQFAADGAVQRHVPLIDFVILQSGFGGAEQYHWTGFRADDLDWVPAINAVALYASHEGSGLAFGAKAQIVDLERGQPGRWPHAPGLYSPLTDPRQQVGTTPRGNLTRSGVWIDFQWVSDCIYRQLDETIYGGGYGSRVVTDQWQSPQNDVSAFYSGTDSPSSTIIQGGTLADAEENLYVLTDPIVRYRFPTEPRTNWDQERSAPQRGGMEFWRATYREQAGFGNPTWGHWCGEDRICLFTATHGFQLELTDGDAVVSQAPFRWDTFGLGPARLDKYASDSIRGNLEPGHA